MFGITLDPCPISQIFTPIADRADACWWFLGGYGIQLPISDGGATRQQQQYDKWMIDDFGYRVGKPGWFVRYADYVDTNWALYFACDSSGEGMPRQTLDWLNIFTCKGTDWFGDAGRWGLPADVAFVCRNIDDALWHVFIRDVQDFTVIQKNLLETSDIKSYRFEEFSPKASKQ